ncbi:hypothetical protein D3C84_1248350 [compost metagenome]
MTVAWATFAMLTFVLAMRARRLFAMLDDRKLRGNRGAGECEGRDSQGECQGQSGSFHWKTSRCYL